MVVFLLRLMLGRTLMLRLVLMLVLGFIRILMLMLMVMVMVMFMFMLIFRFKNVYVDTFFVFTVNLYAYASWLPQLPEI